MTLIKERHLHLPKTRGKYLLTLILIILPYYTEATQWQWIAYGDTRSNDNRHREVLQSIMTNTPDYEFIINVGDVVSHGDDASEWVIWQNACNDVLGGTGQDSIPPRYMSAPGNHDATETTAGLTNWNTYLPGQMQQYGNEGKFFVFDYENARFVILDSDHSSMTGTQYTMLMDAIKNNPKTWLFTVLHHPIFDFGPKHYEDDIHDTWGVPLYQNGCDIMFMGHAHYYVRTKKLELNGEMNPPLDLNNGTVQIVTGNGGAGLYSVDPNHDGNGYMVESYLKDYGYCELTVGEDTLHLKHILRDGTVFDEEYYTPNSKNTGNIGVDKSNESHIPDDFRLYQNYPNPFNPVTSLQFSIPVECHVNLSIYDLKGCLVYTIVDDFKPAGKYENIWYGINSGGSQVSSGIYFYRIIAGGYTEGKKLLLLR